MTSVAPLWCLNGLPELPGPKIAKIWFFAPVRKLDSRKAKGGDREPRDVIEAQTTIFFPGRPGRKVLFRGY
jgi:hypothetical protein